MSLGLGTSLSKSGLVTPGIVTDSLVLKHNYAAGAVVPVSDGACSFGGAATEDRITIASTAFSVHDADHSFAFWAKRSVIGTAHTVLGKTGTGGGYSHIQFTSSNTLIIESDNSGDVATITLHTADTNWHHYAITVTGSGATIVAYQDGVLCTDSGDVGDDNITFDMIGAGGDGGANYEFDGYLCNIGIWDAVLTQPQVKSIMWKSYADLTTTESGDLLHWWALDEGTGTSAADSKGSVTGTFAS